jgi:hypothetical protein
MKTINTIIESVDALKPNTFSSADKAAWIITVDGRVNAEIINDAEYTAPKYPDDGDAELLVPDPYDDLYQKYVEAMIARYSLDYNEYNVLAADFNKEFDDYAAFYRRNNAPTSTAAVKNIW